MMSRFSLTHFCSLVSSAFVLLVLCASGFSQAQQSVPPAATQFPNGDMSAGAEAPEGWKVSWRAAGTLQLLRDTQTFKGTPASLQLRSVDGPATGGASHALETRRVPFTIGGFAKSSGNLTDSQVAIQVFAAGGKQIAWITLLAAQQAKDWQAFSKKVTLPDDTAYGQLVLTFKGEGQVWLDEITLTPEAAPPPVTDATALPVEIAPTDANLRYVGRFDTSDKVGPRAAWPASSVALRLQGTDLNVRIKDTNQNRWQVEVDGKPTVTLQMREGEHLYNVAQGLPAGEHTVRLVKATEAFCGVTQILGFQANQGGRLLPLQAPPHRIEVIGDSISCGYGNEAASKEEKFTPKTENAYFTYGAIAARQLNANYVCVAWSGKKMWPDNTIPEIYDRTLPQDAKSEWDFSQPPPDVVLINLATNDFGKGNPDEVGWTGAYKAFIARLRQHYPQAEIYCATSPMMGDWGANKARSTVHGYLTRIVSDLHAAGDNKVHLIEFAVQDAKNGIGADWHPSIKTHEVMAEKMADTLRKDLGW